MNRNALASFSKAELIALIVALTKQVDVLRKRVAALEAELGKPAKTPDNSSVPPSQGHTARGASKPKPKAKPHTGSHRPLHPNPTRRRDVLADRCEHGRADVGAVPQVAVHAYDRIEIPGIVPEVTRVTLHGGVCRCCRHRFRATPPAGLEPGSPFGASRGHSCCTCVSPRRSHSSDRRG
jgi:transposase